MKETGLSSQGDRLSLNRDIPALHISENAWPGSLNPSRLSPPREDKVPWQLSHNPAPRSQWPVINSEPCGPHQPTRPRPTEVSPPPASYSMETDSEIVAKPQ